MEKQIIVYKKSEDEYCGEITEFIDKYIIGLSKSLNDKNKRIFRTYLCSISKNDGYKVVGFRFPGATRGHIKIDKDNIIEDIIFYSDTCFGHGRLSPLYCEDIVEDIKQFIGQKLIFKESD